MNECNPKTFELGGSGGTIGLVLYDSTGLLAPKFRNFEVGAYGVISSESAGISSEQKITDSESLLSALVSQS